MRRQTRSPDAHHNRCWHVGTPSNFDHHIRRSVERKTESRERERERVGQKLLKLRIPNGLKGREGGRDVSHQPGLPLLPCGWKFFFFYFFGNGPPSHFLLFFTKLFSCSSSSSFAIPVRSLPRRRPRCKRDGERSKETTEEEAAEEGGIIRLLLLFHIRTSSGGLPPSRSPPPPLSSFEFLRSFTSSSSSSFAATPSSSSSSFSPWNWKGTVSKELVKKEKKRQWDPIQPPPAHRTLAVRTDVGRVPERSCAKTPAAGGGREGGGDSLELLLARTTVQLVRSKRAAQI